MTETAKRDIVSAWCLLCAVTHSPWNLRAATVDATVCALPVHDIGVLSALFLEGVLMPSCPGSLLSRFCSKRVALSPSSCVPSSSSDASGLLTNAKPCLACSPCAKKVAAAEGVVTVYALPQKTGLSLMLDPAGFLSLVCLVFCGSRMGGRTEQLLTSLK